MIHRLIVLIALLTAVPLHAAVILQYHHVSADTPSTTSVTPSQFASHLKAIADEGFTVVELTTLVAKVQAGLDPQEKVLAITFDDAYSDLLDAALPLLEQYGWPAAIFVTTSQIGGKGMLSDEQLVDIHRQGHLLLNHTATHEHLLRRRREESEQQWLARVSKDIDRAQVLLEMMLGTSLPRYLAWPYGESDDALRDLLRGKGYIAFGQQTGALDQNTDWQQVPRIAINQHYADWPSLGDKVRALPMPVSDVVPASGVTLSETPVLQFSLPLDWVKKPLNCFVGGKVVEPLRQVADQGQTVRLQGSIPVGRSRATCTALGSEGRYYWFSWQWMRRTQSGWYDE